MKISVITISFNQEKYIKECIESVLSQDYKNFEYIIVDPGSRDNSRDLINSYGDKLIKVFKSDSGPADGLNNGLDVATGDLFYYINADDYVLPGAFSAAVEIFINKKNADVLIADGVVVDGASSLIRKVYSDKFSLRSAAYGSCISIQPASFYKMHAVKDVMGFNKLNKSNWDGELLVDIAINGGKIINVRDFWGAYRVYGESITGSGKFLDLHNLYEERMFKKIMCRDKNRLDYFVAKIMKIRRRVLNYRDSFERVFKGPVFGGGK